MATFVTNLQPSVARTSLRACPMGNVRVLVVCAGVVGLSSCTTLRTHLVERHEPREPSAHIEIYPSHGPSEYRVVATFWADEGMPYDDFLAAAVARARQAGADGLIVNSQRRTVGNEANTAVSAGLLYLSIPLAILTLGKVPPMIGPGFGSRSESHVEELLSATAILTGPLDPSERSPFLNTDSPDPPEPEVSAAPAAQ